MDPKSSPEASAKNRAAADCAVLIASHSHPRLTKGGAEIAAYELFKALRARPEFRASFLGCVRDQMNQKLGATISQPFADSEYLYASNAFDWFKFANQDPNFPTEFRDLLKALSPKVVHFHHYINFGVEAILHARQTLPNCRIIVTLHEYLAICHHFGQMITKQHHTLCYGATPLDCSKCFKDITPSDFFLRKLYIRRFFDLVDHFISPSRFLADRYVAWGVPEAKISVIENAVPPPAVAPQPKRRKRDQSAPLRVGFFGQVSVLKGIDVLFDTAEFLESQRSGEIVFEIYGDYSGQPPEFQTRFLSRIEKAGRNVIFHGPYDSSRVDKLMSSVDLVLVPSIWWENSPVVIQEALRNKKPIVCSDIGGMAEKVRPDIDGVHFPVGNAVALASVLVEIIQDTDWLTTFGSNMQGPPSVADVVSKHRELYASLLQ